MRRVISQLNHFVLGIIMITGLAITFVSCNSSNRAEESVSVALSTAEAVAVDQAGTVHMAAADGQVVTATEKVGATPTALAAPTVTDTAIFIAPELIASAKVIFAPLPAEAAPADYGLTDELIALGRMLYYENRLSISQEMSCNTCHLLDQYGVDGLPTSLGHDGKPVVRNSPTVYNAALHIAQFWDGRAADVEEQARGPILAAGEMGMPDADYVEGVLRSIPGYVERFTALFPDDDEPVTYHNATQAIGAFERRLMTPARFDRFLAGDMTQLSEQEQQGLATFISTGCITCHAGATIGGQLYRKLGLVIPYEVEDLGRFKVTGNEEDKHVFKVPSLRNVAETGPYLHDGSIATLDEMVRLMAKHQLAQDLSAEKVADIVAFLHTLTGDIPTDYIAVPELPPNGPDTPALYAR